MKGLNALMAVTAIATVAGVFACNDPVATTIQHPYTTYGPAQPMGNGTVRTYVTVSDSNRGVPLEVGVAMSEGVMENLPSAQAALMNHAAMAMRQPAENDPGANAMPMVPLLLDLPAANPTPYKFVQFDWNPVGHDPAGVYDQPHFDFHFYTVGKDVRASILPTDPAYAAKAAHFPADTFRVPFYLDAATAGQVTPAQAAVPEMGLHWLDVRSPELQQLAGHPELYQQFTKTYLYGSWNGQFIFDEPMITRDYLVAKKTATTNAVRDELILVPIPARRQVPGYYPSAYRITWDPQAKEYRVAVTQFTRAN